MLHIKIDDVDAKLTVYLLSSKGLIGSILNE